MGTEEGERRGEEKERFGNLHISYLFERIAHFFSPLAIAVVGLGAVALFLLYSVGVGCLPRTCLSCSRIHGLSVSGPCTTHPFAPRTYLPAAVAGSCSSSLSPGENYLSLGRKYTTE